MSATTRTALQRSESGVAIYGQNLLTLTLLYYGQIDRLAIRQISRIKLAYSADMALSEAPHNTDVWLLLAGLSLRFNWATPSPTAALKMSYYTGPSKLTLIPLRLSLAAKSNALSDPEIQQFVQRDPAHSFDAEAGTKTSYHRRIARGFP